MFLSTTTSIVSILTTALLESTVVGILVLESVGLIIQNELFVETKGRGIDRVKRSLNFGILPLVSVFAVIMIVKIIVNI